MQVGRLMRPVNEDDLGQEPLFDDHAYVVASPQHRMARRRKVTLADLLKEQWSLPPTETNVAGQMFSELFRAQGFDFPKSSIVTPSIQVHCGLLATGRYIAIFPGSLLQFGLEHMPLNVLLRFPRAPRPSRDHHSEESNVVLGRRNLHRICAQGREVGKAATHQPWPMSFRPTDRCLLLAPSAILQQGANPVAFGAKRTSTGR